MRCARTPPHGRTVIQPYGCSGCLTIRRNNGEIVRSLLTFKFKEYVMKNRVFLLVITMLFILIGLHGYAGAAGQEFIPVPLEIPHAVGVGGGITPDYEGSDDYTFVVAPLFNYQFGERYIRLLANYLSINLINHENFRLGPSGVYRFGRDNDVDDDVVKRMKEIDDSIEIGGFAGVNYVHPSNPRIRAGATIESLFDVSGSHDGYIIQFSVRGWYPLLKMLDFGMAAGTTYASDDYMQTNFSVTPEDSARTGVAYLRGGLGGKGCVHSGNGRNSPEADHGTSESEHGIKVSFQTRATARWLMNAVHPISS